MVSYAWLIEAFIFFGTFCLVFLGGVFNKTSMPLTLAGYEMIIGKSLRAPLAIYQLISSARSWNNRSFPSSLYLCFKASLSAKLFL